MKIDCHTHIVNQAIWEEYNARTDNYALIMTFLERFEDFAPPDDALALVQREPKLFLCPAIDIHQDIPAQLEQVAKRLGDTPIVGLKVYLTYQKGRADDPTLFPIYEFAQEHGLSVTFHTGSCSLVLPTDNDMEGCRACYVQKAARAFPGVNFILAHMDDPRYEECIRIVHETENLFTDFSGAYEPGTHEGEDINWAIATFKKAIHQFPDTYQKILYGTDFCPPINLSAIDEFDTTIAGIFPPEQWEDIYVHNALRAFPKLKTYLGE